MSYWPALNSPFFREMFESDADVAITEIGLHVGSNEAILHGGLCVRPGKRRIIHIDHAPAEAEIDRLVAQHIQYVICDDRLTIPESLKQRVTHVETAGGVWVGRLPSTL